jgi:hypothetical protein
MALILSGGLFPQPGVAHLYAVAEQVLQAREPAATSPTDATKVQLGLSDQQASSSR